MNSVSGTKWSPPSVIKTDQQMIEYITTKAKPSGDCLLWVGSSCQDGAPRVHWNKKKYRAQRLLYKLTHHWFDEKNLVITTCGHKKCVNPDHLKMQRRDILNRTMAENNQFPKGQERSLNAALRASKTAVLGIDKLQDVIRLRSEGKTWKDIGDFYGLSGSAAWSAYKRWKNTGLV